MKIPISKIKIIALLGIPLISIFLHWKVFQMDLISIHVWRQTQTQIAIENFYAEDFNILNPRQHNRGNGDGIFRMEFPIMQWIFAGAYKIFGNHLIIVRILSLSIGLFSVLGMYFLSKFIFKNEIIALLSTWFLNFSPSFFYHTINPLPDNFALCCGIWGLAFFYKFINTQKNSNLLFSGIFLALAALAKLPFIIFVSVPFAYHLFFWRNISKQKNHLFLFILYGLQLIPLGWYSWVIPSWHGNSVAMGIFGEHFSALNLLYIIWGNVTSTLPELLLNYATVPLFLFGVFTFFKGKYYLKKAFRNFVFLLLGLTLYFLFEMNMIGLIHDYYLFPFLPILFLLVGFGGFHLSKIKKTWSKPLILLAIIIAPLTAHLRISNRWNLDNVGFNKDFLTYKKELRNAVPNDALCIIGNDESAQILFYYVDKKGWNFKGNTLSKDVLKHYIQNGAKFLYSDSREVDTSSELQQFFEKKIMEQGSVHIYQLKSPHPFEKN